jgi:hypothetical protein
MSVCFIPLKLIRVPLHSHSPIFPPAQNISSSSKPYPLPYLSFRSGKIRSDQILNMGMICFALRYANFIKTFPFPFPQCVDHASMVYAIFGLLYQDAIHQDAPAVRIYTCPSFMCGYMRIPDVLAAQATIRFHTDIDMLHEALQGGGA